MLQEISSILEKHLKYVPFFVHWVEILRHRDVTPETKAHQAPPSLGFSRQEHWSGLPFPSPMHENEK